MMRENAGGGLSARSSGSSGQRAYAEAQHDAQRDKHGFCKGNFVLAWRYRACLRSPATRPAACSDEAG
ncbi:hypothetical protein AC630_30010 [Bradyrhizobium sp. AS23.2]|nr:hypothetical protein AC630_30010 [Bradyrhizobium sp. AS23.2]